MEQVSNPFRVFLFQFTGIWNDLLFGLTLSTSESVRPVMVGMASMQGQYGNTSMPVVLTAALITSLPTLLLFFYLRKSFMEGFAMISK
jgi:multiple sugar transport system permease protein